MKIFWYLIADLLSISILVIDLFCGAGGTTSGFESAEVKGNRIAKVIVCVNHDQNAIRSHEANHPDTVHMTEDIRIQAMEPIVKVLQKWRAMCPWAKVVLWASLECTNHSNAKGGDSRDADSRSLAEHLDRYIIALNPDYVWIENVREFRLWGPLIQKIHKKTGKPVFHKDKKTKQLVPTMVPDKTKLKIFFNKWLEETKSLGYTYDDRDFNAANFNAHQNRVRYFGSFAKHGLKHIFPKPFTAKGRPVKEVLDFSDEGEGIFDPNRKKKITSPKTLLRLKAGILKHVVPGREAMLVKFTNHGNGNPNAGPSMDEPSPTICANQRLALAKTVFISKYYGGNYHHSINVDSPAGTVTAIDHHSMVNCEFLTQYYGEGGSQAVSIDRPSPALTTKDRLTKCKVYFIDNTYGQSKPTSIENTVGALSTNPHHYLVNAQWIDNRYGSGSHNHQSINAACGSILQVPKQALMTSKFIFDNSFSDPPRSLEMPCPTIIARQDKKPIYLASCDQGYPHRVIIRETSNPKAAPVHILPSGTVVYNLPGESLLQNGTKKQKDYYSAKRELIELMASYGIIDIKMRMLNIVELLQIQGFPKNYKLEGTQAEKKKYIGNAVYTGIPKKWAEDAYEELEPDLLMAA